MWDRSLPLYLFSLSPSPSQCRATGKLSTMKPSSSSFSPFKSKKITRSSSKSASLDEIRPSDPNTPEKPMQRRRGNRNRGVAFSVNEVGEIARGLRKSNQEGPSDESDLIRSSGRTANKYEFVNESSKKPTCSIKLPEKHEIMAKFFDSMECSIRLLGMKEKMTTFTNICPGIESLTDRRFSYNHLAQLKYILPEAIVLEKLLLHDEKTLCMKPDLQVTLQTDLLEKNGSNNGGSGCLSLSKLFRARLLDFIKSHPEGYEVPEETLPEPFTRTKQNILTIFNEANVLSMPLESSEVLPQQYSAAASHLSQSFHKWFAERIPIPDSEKTKLLSTTLKPSTEAAPDPCCKEAYSNEETPISVVPSLKHSKPPTIRKTSLLYASPVKIPSSSSPLTTFDEDTKPMKNNDCSLMEVDCTQGTPAKLVFTPAGLMTVTPDLQTPKRCFTVQHDDSTASPNKLLRRPPRNRSLFTSPVKNAKAEIEKNEMGRSSAHADAIKLLPESLLQSIREKEKKAIEDQDIGISQAKRRRQMVACLPKLFDIIHLIFQSIKRWVITKEELIHKIIMGHCDIVDRNEVEEQLKLLQELVPDCICEVASGGDLLVRINKVSCPELIQKRLAEAL